MGGDVLGGSLGESLDAIAAEVRLSGAIRVDLDGRLVHHGCYGLAHRGYGVAPTPDTRFGVASGAKGLTALVVMRLVEQGVLTLDTTARSLLGADLPLVDPRVTVEHLLGHRSGIGDYLDESQFDDANAYVMRVPVHQLDTAEGYLAALDGYPQIFAPGERFEYCNGGYVVLALLAERAARESYHDLVDRLVCLPAGMTATAFLRSDELPVHAALGYLHDADHQHALRTNLLHLPVRGCGDGGAYTTAADVHALWDAVYAGRIVTRATLQEMTRSRSESADGMGYGLGFWLDGSTGAVSLHGFDAGVGFVSVRDPGGRFTFTVFSNQTRGAWPVSQQVGRLVNAAAERG